MIRLTLTDPGCHIGRRRRRRDWRRSLITVCSGESDGISTEKACMSVVTDSETTRPKSRSTSMAGITQTDWRDQILMTRKTHFSFAGSVQNLASSYSLDDSFWWFWWLSLVVTQNGFTEFKTFPEISDRHLRMPILQFSFDFIESTDWKIEIVSSS